VRAELVFARRVVFRSHPLAPPSYCAVEGRAVAPRPSWRTVIRPPARSGQSRPSRRRPEQMATALSAGAAAGS
jgi:hypothetical protein